MQKYQIGDICRVAHADNRMRYPLKKDEEETAYGCYVMILGSYGQIYPQINPHDTSDYSVYIPKHLNSNLYDETGLAHIPNVGWISGEFGWSWATDTMLEFVKKPTKEDLRLAIEYNKNSFGKYYDGYIHIWKNWEDMAQSYINLPKDN